MVQWELTDGLDMWWFFTLPKFVRQRKVKIVTLPLLHPPIPYHTFPLPRITLTSFHELYGFMYRMSSFASHPLAVQLRDVQVKLERIDDPPRLVKKEIEEQVKQSQVSSSNYFDNADSRGGGAGTNYWPQSLQYLIQLPNRWKMNQMLIQCLNFNVNMMQRSIQNEIKIHSGCFFFIMLWWRMINSKHWLCFSSICSEKKCKETVMETRMMS